MSWRKRTFAYRDEADSIRIRTSCLDLAMVRCMRSQTAGYREFSPNVDGIVQSAVAFLRRPLHADFESGQQPRNELTRAGAH